MKNSIFCPFCETVSSQLLTTGLNIQILKKKQVIGGGPRFALCPQCKSTDRERLIYLYLKEEIKILRKDFKGNILHFAPELKILKAICAFEIKNYYCVDINPSAYNGLESIINEVDILNIPCGDNFFDVIICNHVLEHVIDDRTAMKELFRVLKPNGTAILQVPISKEDEYTYEDFSITTPQMRETAFGQFDHVRIYGQDYVDKLAQVGFNVERVKLYPKFGNYGLNPDEDIFVGTK